MHLWRPAIEGGKTIIIAIIKDHHQNQSHHHHQNQSHHHNHHRSYLTIEDRSSLAETLQLTETQVSCSSSLIIEETKTETKTKPEAFKFPQNPTLILKSYNSKNISRSRLRFGSRTVEQKRNATSRLKHFVKSSKCKPLQPPSFLLTTILRASTSKKTLSTIVNNRCFQEANKPASSKASKPTRCSSQIQ